MSDLRALLTTIAAAHARAQDPARPDLVASPVVFGTGDPLHPGRFAIGAEDGALIAALREIADRAPSLLATLPDAG